MSDKVKKQATSMSFSLSRWFSKISTMKPSMFIINTSIIAVTILLLSGAVFSIINSFSPVPFPLYAYINERFYFIFSNSIGGSLSTQFISEAVIIYMLMALGFIGLIATYKSTKYAYERRQAYMTLAIGLSLALLSYLFIEYVLSIKMYM